MMEQKGEQNPHMQILSMIESGVITAEEGARLLQAFESEADQADLEDVPPAETVPAGSPPDIGESLVAEAGEVTDGWSGPPLGEFDEQIDKWRR